MQVILVMWSHVFEIDAEGEMDKSPGWSLLYEFLVRNLKELGLWFTLQCSKTESSEHYPTKEILYFFLKSQGKLKKSTLKKISQDFQMKTSKMWNFLSTTQFDLIEWEQKNNMINYTI